MSSDAPRPDAWVCAADARVSALTQRTPNVRLRARATPRRRAAGVALAADRTPQLIPLAARPAPPVALSRVAYAQARRAGLVVDTSRVTPAPAAAHAAGVRSAPGTPRTPPASPWGQPRAWGSGTPRAPNARAAVLAHSPAVSVRTDTASPTRAPRATRAPRPARTLDELYDGAHTRFAAPLTVPVGLVNQGNSCFASAVRGATHADLANARVLPPAVQLSHGAARDAPPGPVELHTAARGHVRVRLTQLPLLRRDPARGAHAAARDGDRPDPAGLRVRCDAPAQALRPLPPRAPGGRRGVL